MAEIFLTHGASGVARVLAGERCRATRTGEACAVMYGPYEERAAGRYRIEFGIGRGDDISPLGDPIAATLDVRAKNGTVLVAERFVLHSQLTSGLTRFALEFELQETQTLEYRILATGKVALVASDKVEFVMLGDGRKLAKARTRQETVWENEREFLDGYLRNVTGLIHVGANFGQERQYYWIIGLDVVWVEPIREIYDALVDRLARYPRQRAINALLASRAGEPIEFRIANNNGASSSILALEDHAVIFPDVSYVEHRTIISTTLEDLVTDAGIPIDQYKALTLDVEGAEKMVLEGAPNLLSHFDYVKCEVADFPARTGTPTVTDLDHILRAAGFEELARRPFADGPNNEGTFWDIVWKKATADQHLHDPHYTLPLIFNAMEVIDIEKCE